ncbi:hypothetical protein ABZM97_02820 [Bacillus vallismortis]|uniref:PTS mannose transporter subunit IID n=1 Tax=Bacillus vallismortis TaxID=72361 RepID=A0ABY4Y090_BACVA|nr:MULTISPECIES: hypothetical protein [Bacillus]MBL3649724.1 hypothetical protein [Bacillus sp. RHFS10]MCC2117374.1 hypothetical protein [Bacillus halotolerans]MDM5300588.1 hypothetical protein [Bacillus subtilis]MDM5322641.1 hypothetical protein [Bacillus subtilis]MEC1645136.1 hypothetical protein [Bacillus halotolerans]
MNKSTLKGIISTVIGAMLINFLFFWKQTDGIFDFIIWLGSSAILGYIIFAPFTMSKKEMKNFEEKVDKWLEDDDSVKN